MSISYTKLAATAKKLLTNFGQSVTLVIPADGAYDPDTGTGTRGEARESRMAALLDFERINFGMTLQDGSRILANDRRCIMDANGTAPTTHHFVEVAGERFPIKDVKILNPAGTPVLYDLLIRK